MPALSLISKPGIDATSMALNESQLTALLPQKDEAAFEQVFKSNFKNLHAYACTIVQEEVAAEEIVQNVFLKLWERAEWLNIQSTVIAYLYRAVHNESCNHLKHQKVKNTYTQYAQHSMNPATNDSAARKVLVSELEQKIRSTLNELPEQCRTIFQLSRFEELKYQEIADKLSLSIKTVEAQMGKALRIMRVKLVDYLPFAILFTNL